MERRIEDLEYYASLSLLETNLVNKIIPSSIDGSLDRFKFGFFVDDYSTRLYCDTANPQYAADIEVIQPSKPATNLLVPPKFVWVLKHFTNQFAASYTEFLLVDQNNATSPPAPNNATSPPAPNTVTANDILQVNAILWSHGNLQPLANVTTVANIQMSTTSGNCMLYFYFEDDPFITIYQNNSPLIDITSSVALTNAEVTSLATNPYTAPFMIGFSDESLKKFPNLGYIIQMVHIWDLVKFHSNIIQFWALTHSSCPKLDVGMKFPESYMNHLNYIA